MNGRRGETAAQSGFSRRADAPHQTNADRGDLAAKAKN
jgi:hypothetical protein